ncbi:hypothetical protein Vau01_106710 [Virgisporangium aurantiacum]|uniref:Uncharacterized protein n=1 Tax=Virgisporangium aurantiacum TaxID=175570 RepID=A0A8J3ZKJ7_9ACTN|nr:hypothetical protein Vau01_106710 [Virgisporangium aurantiacum]
MGRAARRRAPAGKEVAPAELPEDGWRGRHMILQSNLSQPSSAVCSCPICVRGGQVHAFLAGAKQQRDDAGARRSWLSFKILFAVVGSWHPPVVYPMKTRTATFHTTPTAKEER